MTFLQHAKTERIDVRASGQVKALLQEAAKASHKNVSEFLLDAGIAMAHETLAEQRLFSLTDEQWEQFQAALDRPVQEKPQLRKLLTETGVLG
jgi:uncharacterized protein (DUF1778 family)